MNSVLHHFGKEFRWLWPRWVVFLAVLGFDLAMSLGCVQPMILDGKYGLYEMMTVLLWMVALWVGISGAPEDSAEGGLSAISPLSGPIVTPTVAATGTDLPAQIARAVPRSFGFWQA